MTSSARQIGEIFSRAGEAYNQLGDAIMMLHPTGQELLRLEAANAKNVCSDHA